MYLLYYYLISLVLSTVLLTNQLWTALIKRRIDENFNPDYLRVMLLVFTAPFLWLLLIRRWVSIIIHSRKNKIPISISIDTVINNKKEK